MTMMTKSTVTVSDCRVTGYGHRAASEARPCRRPHAGTPSQAARARAWAAPCQFSGTALAPGPGNLNPDDSDGPGTIDSDVYNGTSDRHGDHMKT
jgi:hypothetical protein